MLQLRRHGNARSRRLGLATRLKEGNSTVFASAVWSKERERKGERTSRWFRDSGTILLEEIPLGRSSTGTGKMLVDEAGNKVGERQSRRSSGSGVDGVHGTPQWLTSIFESKASLFPAACSLEVLAAENPAPAWNRPRTRRACQRWSTVRLCRLECG